MAVSGAVDASRRRVVFGVNAAVQALLAVALLVAVIWLGGRFHWQRDLTSSGLNSLSPRTKQLLGSLTQNIRITAVFPEPDKERDPVGQKRYGEIRDLLELYDAAGRGHMTTHILDPSLQKAETDKVLQRLRELPAYRDEVKPRQEAMAKFSDLNQKLQTLLNADADRLATLAKADSRLSENRSLQIVQANLEAIRQMAANTAEDMQSLLQGDVPRYGPAVRGARDYLNRIRAPLREVAAWMKSDALSMPAITPELRAFFTESPERYDGLLANLDTLSKSLESLGEGKLDNLLNELTRWRTSGPPVLVESSEEARVLSFADVWPMSTEQDAPPGPDGDRREFAGEAAISSAILQLTQKDRTAVVFTHFGGPSPIRPDFSQMNQMMRQMPTAPCQQLVEVLDKNNFLTEDWDVSKDKQPPKVENAARTVYVVYPPTPPPRPNPMEPAPQRGITPEDRQIILSAVQASGMGIFLAGWAEPQSPMPGMPGNYEFADYLKNTWGIEVEYQYLVYTFTPHPEKRDVWVPMRPTPWVITSEDEHLVFTDDPITKPLQTLTGAFEVACPLRLVPAASRPAGLHVDPLVEVRRTNDIWAVANYPFVVEDWRREQGVRPTPADVRAPFPLAAAASKDSGGKVVVFGSDRFLRDELAQAKIDVATRAGFTRIALFPANTEVFINSLYWLTGNADRISVDARRGNAPMLTRLTPTWAERLPWLLVIVWPALALAAGVGMWLLRRR